MPICPSCATENAEGARFCNACGARLVAPPQSPLPEERKVVTALFCDLVGFTATSEGADPEDVDQMLTRYFATARAHVEAHGGIVEKFIGDAIVGVFGVPAAHEDDPERAVRAALRIAADAAELPALRGAPLRLRIGINTGEALVRHGVEPGRGERFLAGDAINTASRIQSVAPEMGVAVGLTTYEATAARFEYEELEPATLKGKAEPVRIFHPIAPRARLGVDLTRAQATPFVGREADLRQLTDLFDEAVSTRAVRFAAIVGEPGIGKSRLVAELLAYVDAQPMLVTWRQGRCLPYGAGISFWALGEIVKAHAGILESDPQTVAIDKLARILPASDDHAWLVDRLLPLIGIESASRAERDEQFTAWRRFVELIASDRPTVIVFEDLHWADDPMLGFLEMIAEEGPQVPLLVVGTSRPELRDRRSTLDAAALRIDLEPLSADAAGSLVDRLLDVAVIGPELRQPILERAEGNPLFVEECIRLLKDRDILERIDGDLRLREGASLPLPDSIHSLLAARLDALPADWKALLADAAVVGKVFWAGAVTAMGERDAKAVDEALEALSRKEFVRGAQTTTMAGEREYTFWHVLLRDVAYAGLPRAARATRHVAASQWIEARAGDRVEDVADVVAYHYTTAMDLALATGDVEAAARLRKPALRSLTLAGERAINLDSNRAAELLERALALTPPGDADRGPTLVLFGRVIQLAGRYADSAAALEEALELARARGDVHAQAEAMLHLTFTWIELGDPRAAELPNQLIEMLEPFGPSQPLAEAYGRAAGRAAIEARWKEALTLLDRAADVADAAHFKRESEALSFRALLLGFRAYARSALGERAALDDFREAIRMAVDSGNGNRVTILYNNMTGPLASYEGPQAAARHVRDGIDFARSRGLHGATGYLSLELLLRLVEIGELDEATALIAELRPGLEAGGSVRDLGWLRYVEQRVLALRGDRDLLERDLASESEDIPRDSDTEILVARLTGLALANAGLGRTAPTVALLDQLQDLRPAAKPDSADLLGLQRAAVAVGRRDYVKRLADVYANATPNGEHVTVHARAAVAEVRGDLAAAASGYGNAAARWKDFGVVTERAFALLGLGRCLIATGDAPAATTALAEARDTFARLRATPALEEAEALLARVRTEPARMSDR
jgi:class 3 adenylate cyclase/tetratricopeptide (TPR) repeat protein